MRGTGLGFKWIALGAAAFLGTIVPLRGVSVADFGAVGDGKTDATAAFQEAIDRAGETGEAVEVPAGVFLIGGDLEVGVGVEFVGEGNAVSVLTAAGGEARILVAASGTGFRDIGFEEMKEPIALVARRDYVLEDLRFTRCRFEGIEALDSNRGTIGLSSGKSGQRGFRIRRITISECLFRRIRGSAVNIRADLSEVEILGSRFEEIGKMEEDDPGESAYAIRLGGYVEKEDGVHDKSPNQGKHRIVGNRISGMRKSSVAGSLKGILIYGDECEIRANVIEDIDGGEAGEDTNAMYIRGAFNTVSGNVVRNIRGADDDGAISFKGEWARGSRRNVIAGNLIEGIRGMSAVEVSSSDLLFVRNVVRGAEARGFYHRSGENATIRENRFIDADVLIRSSGGDVEIAGNEFVRSGVILGQRRSHPSERESVTIAENRFLLEGEELAIWLENDVVDRRVAIWGNRFSGGGGESGGDGAGFVDLEANGSVGELKMAGNRVVAGAGSE